ncbi:MAG TPA: spermine synthase [Thermodesulfatator atlanticus]|uniref:Polyamine aminopropyltransferase n=1 Tax=Thermodesulfatator atlanticus TaxID=501497 RepID=A0A7V5NYE7_9BACT|nr:spermine synthase [Thermodesulfatator atlanticus]
MTIMADSLPTEGQGIRLILGEPVQRDFFYVYHGNIIHSEGGPQTLYVMDHVFWGRILFLNGTLQFTTRDEFIYHEALVHIPVQSRPEKSIKKVLICGGGDFGAARELLKYQDIEKIIIADIDPRVPEVVKKFFPELLPEKKEDPRLELLITDAYKLVADLVEKEEVFDLVIIDSTDPDVAPEGSTIELSHSLFSPHFHELLKRLAPEGLVVQQAATPFTMKNVLEWTYRTFVEVYGPEEVYCYRADIPSFGGDNAYLLRAPEEPTKPRRELTVPTKYYTHALHTASFSLPKFWTEVLK